MLKVHVGCGKNYIEGWVNCDLTYKYQVDKVWDLTSPYPPFESDSVDYIFIEHVLEHFSLKQGIKILKTFNTLLKKGGVLRVVVPSLESLVSGYLNDEGFKEVYNELNPDAKIAFSSQLVNKAFYGYGHKNMYDKQLLSFALKSAGFTFRNMQFFDDDEVGDCTFNDLGRRKYKINSSVQNLSVEVVCS